MHCFQRGIFANVKWWILRAFWSVLRGEIRWRDKRAAGCGGGEAQKSLRNRASLQIARLAVSAKTAADLPKKRLARLLQRRLLPDIAARPRRPCACQDARSCPDSCSDLVRSFRHRRIGRPGAKTSGSASRSKSPIIPSDGGPVAFPPAPAAGPSSLSNRSSAMQSASTKDGQHKSRLCAAIEPISMRIPDACRYTGISRSTLYLLIARKEVEIIKLGASTLVVTESLRQLIDRRLQPASAPTHAV